ncbi:MAG: IS1595 family transposase [Bacteroidales bacterium]|nr:IS1595 family transposase [Candidatus Latescibacterota bacterium]
MSQLSAQYFHDEQAAREYLEKVRWPDGVVCPHCGGMDKAYKLEGKSTRPGLYKCGHCRKPFTVTVGTLFERSHIPLHKWLLAAYLLCSSKKGISSHQLHRTLDVTYKTAWFMSHRIRAAMKDSFFVKKIGGGGNIVEADETYWGTKYPKPAGARGYAHKESIFSLVERGGHVRSFHVNTVTGKTLKPIMQGQINRDTHIVTDEMGAYKDTDRLFEQHSVVTHSKGEYVRGPVHTNTIEGFFSILKRGLVGIYQHVGSQHLKRYIGEYDFRYNHRHIGDIQRTIIALRGIAGKRLMYCAPQAR